MLARVHGAEVRFVGTRGRLEERLVPAAGFSFQPIEAQPLVRRPSMAALRAPVIAIRSIADCRSIASGADVVVGMGGYVSVPLVLAATRTRTPIVLHEQNAVPGLANRLLSRRARVVAVSFAEAVRAFPRRVRTVHTGNPVRRSVLLVRDERDALAKEALGVLDLEPGRRTVVVFGGSQGALRIDRATAGMCSRLRERDDLQLLVITGPDHVSTLAAVAGREGALGVRALGFLDRMELAYAVADLVVARAGATTIAEVAVTGNASLLIPYPHATGNHQEANARTLQRAGAASVLLDAETTPDRLTERVATLIEQEQLRTRMAERAAAWARPDAAEALAGLVVEAAA